MAGHGGTTVRTTGAEELEKWTPPRGGDGLKEKTKLRQTNHSEATGRILVLAMLSSEVHRHALQKMLNPRGVQTMCPSSPDDALAALRDSVILPDLLLIDTNLPDVSGYKLVSRIRAEWDSVQLPIILLGGSMEHKMTGVQKADLVGADDIIFKPVRAQDLASCFAVQLYSRELMRQHALVSLIENGCVAPQQSFVPSPEVVSIQV